MTAAQGLRAIHLEAENFKRLRAITVDLADGLQVISGRNGQGKTSAIDSLWAALGGAKATKDTPEPIRQGERKASVKVVLGRGDGPELVVTRTWKAGGASTLAVTAPDGAKHPKAQTVLDDLVGALSFDPLAFTNLPPKRQREQLLELVDLPFDPEALQAERDAIYAQRTEVNREVGRLAARLDQLPAPAADLPDTEVSVADLIAEHQAATEDHRQRQVLVAQVDDLEVLVADLSDRLAAAKVELTRHREAYAQLPELPDVAAIEARMRDAEGTNALVRQAAERRAIAADHDRMAEQARKLTEAIEARDRKRADGLAAATMPIPGLGFDGDGVTFNGLPLSQASGAEQLRVSLAIAMAANPTLRLMLIRDGSLLDADGLQLVANMADANGYQVLVERVAGSGGPTGIVIEDGQVVDGGADDVDLDELRESAEADEAFTKAAEAAAEQDLAQTVLDDWFAWLTQGGAS